MKKILSIIFISSSLIVFSQDGKETGFDGIRNFAIKFSPTQLAAGEFNFTYEQRVAKRISLELEVGPTISQFGLNFGNQRLWQGDLGLWKFNSLGDEPDAAIGFHVAIAPRFYPVSDEYLLKGLYLSPQFKFRRYNYEEVDYTETLGNVRSTIDQTIFRFNMGLQFWPGDGDFCIDMFFGVGLGTFAIKGNDIIYTEDPVGSGNVTYEWKSNRDTGVRFNAVTGIRFGFGM